MWIGNFQHAVSILHSSRLWSIFESCCVFSLSPSIIPERLFCWTLCPALAVLGSGLDARPPCWVPSVDPCRRVPRRPGCCSCSGCRAGGRREGKKKHGDRQECQVLSSRRLFRYEDTPLGRLKFALCRTAPSGLLPPLNLSTPPPYSLHPRDLPPPPQRVTKWAPPKAFEWRINIHPRVRKPDLQMVRVRALWTK